MYKQKSNAIRNQTVDFYRKTKIVKLTIWSLSDIFMFLLSFLGRLCTAKKKRHNKCKLQRFIEFSFAAYNIVVIQIMINIYGSSFNCKCRPPNMFCFSVIFLYTTQEKVFLKIYSYRWIHFANYLRNFFAPEFLLTHSMLNTYKMMSFN